MSSWRDSDLVDLVLVALQLALLGLAVLLGDALLGRIKHNLTKGTA